MKLPHLISILLVYLPLFLLALIGKIIRGLQLDSITSLPVFFNYIGVELLLFPLLILVLLFFSYETKNKISLWLYWCLFYLLAFYILIAELFTLEVFRQSGLFLDWPNIVFSFERSAIMLDVLSKQLHPLMMAGIVLLLLYFVFAPLLAYKYHLSTPSVPLLKKGEAVMKKKESFPLSSSSWRSGLLLMVIFLLFMLFLLNHSYHNDDLNIEEYQGGSLNIILSYFDSQTVQIDTPDEHVAYLSAELKPKNPQQQYKNVAIIMLESTRRRSVDPYVDLNITPFFESFAKTSLLLENMYTTTPHTSRAIYSILCGFFPRSGKGIVETLPGGVNHDCLAHLLSEQGYQSAFFQSATEDFEYRRQLVKNMGFKEFFPLEVFNTQGYEHANYFGYEDNIMLPDSERWIRANKDKPFFASYLTVTPHFHYDPISRYGWKNYAKKKALNAYLNTLHYQDNFLKNLIAQYKESGLYEKTVFIVLGDHGEAFREHKVWGHGNILFEEVARVPFLLHYAGQLKGKLPERGSLLDIVPTVVDYLGFEFKENIYPGLSVSALAGSKRDILLECVYDRYCSALIDGQTDLKYFHNYQRKPDALYDLNTDPYEQKNLIKDKKYADVIVEMRKRLDNKVDKIRHSQKLENYNSWGMIRHEVQKLNQLPQFSKHSGDDNQILDVVLQRGHKDYAIIQANLNKSIVNPGDGLLLNYYLPFKVPLCLLTEVNGIKRHQRRTHQIASQTEALIGIKETLKVSKRAKELQIKISAYKNCDLSEADFIFKNSMTIPVVDKKEKQQHYDKNQHQLYVKTEPEKILQKNAETYIEELIATTETAGEFSANVSNALSSAKFTNKIRKRLSELKSQYGTYKQLFFHSAWQVSGKADTFIYHFKVKFSKNQYMEMRAKLIKNRVVAFYFYHPWKE